MQHCVKESDHCTVQCLKLNTLSMLYSGIWSLHTRCSKTEFFFLTYRCVMSLFSQTHMHTHTHTHTHKCTCMHAHKSPHTHTLVIMHTIISHTPLHTQICTTHTHTHTHTLQLIYGLCIGVVSLFSHF